MWQPLLFKNLDSLLQTHHFSLPSMKYAVSSFITNLSSGTHFEDFEVFVSQRHTSNFQIPQYLSNFPLIKIYSDIVNKNSQQVASLCLAYITRTTCKLLHTTALLAANYFYFIHMLCPPQKSFKIKSLDLYIPFE